MPFTGQGALPSKLRTRSLSKMECVRLLILGFVFVACYVSSALGESDGGGGQGEGEGKARLLLGFRETKGNASFQCSPSGPCLACQYAEKNDEKYHCSETGYRLPWKCLEVQDDSKGDSNVKNQGRLLGDSIQMENGMQYYMTYRSCVPVDGTEKLSVLGFEAIMMFLLLISSTGIYLRQKRSNVMAGVGAVRIPSNSPSSRF